MHGQMGHCLDERIWVEKVRSFKTGRIEMDELMNKFRMDEWRNR